MSGYSPQLGRVLYKYIPIVLGVLAFLSIARDGFGVQFINAIDILISNYQKLIAALSTIFEPIILIISILIRALIQIEFNIGTHWRDAFILMYIFYLRDFANFYRYKLYIGFAALIAAGLFVSLLSAITVASVELETADRLLIVLATQAPLAGHAVYRIVRAVFSSLSQQFRREGNSFIEDFLQRSLASLQEILYPSYFIGLIVLLGLVDGIYGASLLILASLIFLVSVHNISRGWFRSATGEGTRLARFWHHGNTQYGIELFMIYFWFFVVIFVNSSIEIIISR